MKMEEVMSPSQMVEKVMCCWAGVQQDLVVLIREEGGWGKMSHTGGNNEDEVAREDRLLQGGAWVLDSLQEGQEVWPDGIS